MKLRMLCLVVLCLAALSAMAQQTLYTNGPINGTTDSWPFNFGFVVSDSFTLSSAATVDQFTFGTFTFPGDVLVSAEVEITSAEFGGTTYSDQVVNFTQSDCRGNQYGFNVCVQTGNLSPVNLAAGTYWLNLDNGVVNDGDPMYWDENSGPSHASFSTVGTIPSESFTLLGTTNSGGGTVPEPSSIALFASGVLALAGVLRRKVY